MLNSVKYTTIASPQKATAPHNHFNNNIYLIIGGSQIIGPWINQHGLDPRTPRTGDHIIAQLPRLVLPALAPAYRQQTGQLPQVLPAVNLRAVLVLLHLLLLLHHVGFELLVVRFGRLASRTGDVLLQTVLVQVEPKEVRHRYELREGFGVDYHVAGVDVVQD